MTIYPESIAGPLKINDLANILEENHWIARTNVFGLWIVGPEGEDGVMNVIGMGRTFGEACEMAVRSKESPNGSK